MATSRGMVSGLILTAALVAFTAAGTGQRTLNDGPGRRAEIRVTYGELNLESEAGAQVLLRRIEWAASKVCGGAPQPVELWKQRPYQECVDDAVQRAVSGVNAPLVSALHERKKAKGSKRHPTAMRE